MKVLIETSARHIHLSREDSNKLFGKNYELKIKRNLSQPGEFLSTEKISLEVNGNKFDNISVLGPLREKTQVEVSLTDSRKLKIKVPIRESGNIENSPGGVLIGPNGYAEIKCGIIVAKRHIHMSPSDASIGGFIEGEECNLEVITENRSLIFSQTLIRISEKFKLSAHIDTDESNAAGIDGPVFGMITRSF